MSNTLYLAKFYKFDQMKHFLILFIAFVSVIQLNAQKEHSLFISDTYIDWLSSEVKVLENQYNDLSKDINKADDARIAQSRFSLMKTVTIFEKNLPLILEQFSSQLGDEVKRNSGPNDYSQSQHYERMRRIQNHSELIFNESSLDKLNADSQALLDVVEKLKKNDFKFNPKFEQSETNVTFVKEILNHTNSLNTIIQNNLAQVK